MKKTKASTIKALKNNRQIKVFLFFLALSSIIWLVIELSKNYIAPVVFNVEYLDLPKGKLIQKKPVSELEFAIKATGFTLFKYKVKRHKINLNLKNISKAKSGYYILPNKQLSLLNSQVSSGIEIVNVLRDTIFVEIGTSISKKVRVNPILDIQYKGGYNLVEKLKISPDTVLITGPKKFIDSIAELTTEPLKLSDVFRDIDTKLTIKSPFKANQIKISASKVSVKGKVDKFTEGTFNIPVTIINVPEGVKIITFPREVEAIYQAGLSNFSKITQNDISIVFDYRQYQSDSLITYLTPVVLIKSDYIYALRINPPQLEFLIQK